MNADSQPTARTQVEHQAFDLLDDTELDAVELVGELDFSHCREDDEYPDWHATEPTIAKQEYGLDPPG